MGFFKPSATPVSNKSVARLQTLIWVLIYGGFLSLVLGLAVERNDEATGWPLVLGGGIVAAVGFVLIYVRSRMKVEP
ncbi:MAG: hypothetical protein Q7T87_10595 [Polaromonas sp.]|nr:hypothetical protein [Polaromonas sp.]